MLDISTTLPFVTPLVAMKFNVLPYVLVEPLLFSTQWVTSFLLKESKGVVPCYFPIELHWSIG